MKTRGVLLALALLEVAPVAGSAAEITVMPLARDGQVVVSFALSGGLNDEMLAAIHSGLPTTFIYDLELRRAVPGWFDELISAVTVTAMVRFDNLTRRYQLSRTVDGRVEGAQPSEDDLAVEHWLTRFDRIPVSRTAGLEPNAEYYVRVRARTKPRDTWFFWPWDRGSVLGHAKFTFLPE